MNTIVFNKLNNLAGDVYRTSLCPGEGFPLYKAFALILMVLFLFTGCSSQHKTKEQLVTDGIRLVQEKKPGEAVISFKHALDQDPNYFEARLQLAKAYFAIGKLEAAGKELEKVHRLNPSSRDVKIETARVLVYSGKPDDALREIAGYLSDDTTDSEALEIAGWAHAMKKDYPVARALLKRAVATGGDSDAPLSLATIDMITGKTQDAETELAPILEKDPTNRRALYLLADIQIHRKNKAEALQTFDRIIQAAPRDLYAQYRKGLLYIEYGEYDQALAVSQAMIKQSPKQAEGIRLQGFALFYKQQYIDAIAALQKSLTAQPDVMAYYILGLSLYQRNETEQAINQFQKALDLRPTFTFARIYLSMSLLKKKRLDDAVTEVKQVLREDDDNALAHNVLGSAYLTKGNYTEGIAELNKAIELDPGLADAHIKKGFVALKQGKGREAESELATAVRLKPEQQETRRLLALYYISHNEYAKAIDVLKKGIRGERTDTELYFIIAECFLRQNNASEALKNFEKAKGADPKNDLASIKIASVFFLQGKQEQAVKELCELLDHSPDNVQAELMLAFFAELNGNESDARKYFARAGETGTSEGVIAAAQYYQRTNDTEQALRVLRDASGRLPETAVLYELKGKIQVAAKRYKDAIKTFETLERLNHRIGYAYLMNTYLVMGDNARALEKVRAEIMKDPTNLSLRAELSSVYLHMGKTNDATENAREIIRKNPESSVGYLALAVIYENSNDNDRAIEVLKGVERMRDADIAVKLGNLYYLKRNLSAALEQYQKAEMIKPGSVPILFQKGNVLYAMQKREDAIAEYQKVLRLSPNHALALNNLAYLYAEGNRNLDEALLYSARAFVLAPNNDLIRDTLGFVLIKKGRPEKGLYMLKTALKDNPKNQDVLYHLALGYNAKGDKGQAAENLQKALALGDFPEARNAQKLLEEVKKN